MKKICVFTDIHGNYDQFLKLVNTEDFKTADQRICLGDVVGLGAFQKECMELLIQNDCLCLMGNHEARYIGIVNDLNPERPIYKQFQYFSKELEGYFDYMKKLPFEYRKIIGNKKFLFIHYGWFDSNVANKVPYMKGRPLDVQLNNPKNVDFVLYGHMHAPNYEKIDEVEYFSVGSLGLKSPSNYIMIYEDGDIVKIERKIIESDKEKFIKDSQNKNYPAWDILNCLCFDNDKEVY